MAFAAGHAVPLPKVSTHILKHLSFGALGQGAYELSDETGKIWVVAQRGVPAKGARVGAVGKYVDGVKWGGRTFGSALRETERKVQ